MLDRLEGVLFCKFVLKKINRNSIEILSFYSFGGLFKFRFFKIYFRLKVLSGFEIRNYCSNSFSTPMYSGDFYYGSVETVKEV